MALTKCSFEKKMGSPDLLFYTAAFRFICSLLFVSTNPVKIKINDTDCFYEDRLNLIINTCMHMKVGYLSAKAWN